MYSYQAEVENSLSLPDFSFIKTCSYIYAAQKTDCYLPKLTIYFYRCYTARCRKLTADLGLTL